MEDDGDGETAGNPTSKALIDGKAPIIVSLEQTHGRQDWWA
jgi:hypothetical protein